MNQGYQPPHQERVKRTRRVRDRQNNTQAPGFDICEEIHSHTQQSQRQNDQRYDNRPIDQFQCQDQQYNSGSQKPIKPYILVIASIVMVGIVISILFLTGTITIGKKSTDYSINSDQPKKVTLDEFVITAQNIAKEWEYGELNFIQGKYASSKDGEDSYNAFPSVGVTIAYYCKSESGYINSILVAIDRDRYDTEKENLYITSFIGTWDPEMEKEDASNITTSLLLQTIGSSILGQNTFYSETVRGRAYSSFVYEDWDKYMFVLDFE